MLGLECSGVISEVGAGSSWQLGDRVCALLAGGGMAEEVVVDGRHVLAVPQGLSLIEAAALPEVYATVWLNLFQLAALKPGEKVLLHAGASGIGSAAIQLSPQLAKTFPIKDAEAAFAELATNKVAGKLVLVIDESLT